jgi:hypothetical protein
MHTDLRTDHIGLPSISFLYIYSREPLTTDSVSAVYRGPKKNSKLKK